MPTSPHESEHVCSVCSKKTPCRPIDGIDAEVLRHLEERGLDPTSEYATICTGCLSLAMTHHAREHAREAVRGRASEHDRGSGNGKAGRAGTTTGKTAMPSEVSKEIAERASQIVDEIEHGMPRSLSDRAADALTRIGGSWTFVLSFIGLLIFWAVLNTAVLDESFDPFPFILLNLVLSAMSSIQAPIILMSQSRQSELDRIRATEDFRINLKAELEIAALHEKIDQLTRKQAERDEQLAAVLQILERRERNSGVQRSEGRRN